MLDAQRQLHPHRKINPFSGCHMAYSHSHPPLSAVFASVISPTIFSRFSLSVELEGTAKYLQVREIRKLCNAAPATETWRERRVGMNYTCFRGGLQICPNKCTRGNDCDISSYNARLLNMKGANYSFPPKAKWLVWKTADSNSRSLVCIHWRTFSVSACETERELIWPRLCVGW